jgi:hypothetical protein
MVAGLSQDKRPAPSGDSKSWLAWNSFVSKISSRNELIASFNGVHVPKKNVIFFLKKNTPDVWLPEAQNNFSNAPAIIFQYQKIPAFLNSPAPK